MNRIVSFLSSAVLDEGREMIEIDEQTYRLTALGTESELTFTLNRDKANERDDLELLGIDHPIIQDQFDRWRNVSPSLLGLSVQGTDGDSCFLCLWNVETSSSKGDRQTIVQTIAVSTDGKRMPILERNVRIYLDRPTRNSRLSDQQRLELFTSMIEPALQRELKHKAAVDADVSFNADLIGFIEIV